MASHPLLRLVSEEFRQQHAFVYAVLPGLLFSEAVPGARMLVRLAERGERCVREFLHDAWEDTARELARRSRSPGELSGRPAGDGLVLVTLPSWHGRESFALVADHADGVRYLVAEPQADLTGPRSVGLHEPTADGALFLRGHTAPGEAACLAAASALLPPTAVPPEPGTGAADGPQRPTARQRSVRRWWHGT
ncbi:hypothetical protein [Streptomyces longispororuber]|uniref:hypothetical protein n=1 Tax=Streptomyces longispororuber TaxID=68230 RepID=UPI00210C8927|nr:hypothetical protein [Streptomyces longispororuber]MCQ4210672.1 hypothetical protein [Streptomyces longispororuber]